MAHTDLISIITPAYNAANYIAQTIECVIAQTYTNWEMIVVDDGSTDTTAEVVKQYAQKDSRVKYVYQQNGRQGKARNNALSKATGKYIAFLDADDLWIHNKLEIQLAFLIEQQADLVFSNSYFFTDAMSEENHMYVPPQRYHGLESFRAFLSANKIPILTVLSTKQAIDDCGGFSEIPSIQNAEDYHLWLKMLIAGKTLVSSDTPLAYYRVHANAATSSDKEAIQSALNALINLAQNHPTFQTEIYRMIPVRIDAFFGNNIINNISLVQQLIDIRNAYSNKQMNASFWRFVHSTMGASFFRKVFVLKRKVQSRLYL